MAAIRKPSEKRQRMFKQQKGVCHWYRQGQPFAKCCAEREGKMTLSRPPPAKRQALPGAFATFEHLYDRLDPRRADWKIDNLLGFRRIVLACKACNEARGKARLKEMVEEQRRRSGHGGMNGQEMAESA